MIKNVPKSNTSQGHQASHLRNKRFHKLAKVTRRTDNLDPNTAHRLSRKELDTRNPMTQRQLRIRDHLITPELAVSHDLAVKIWGSSFEGNEVVELEVFSRY